MASFDSLLMAVAEAYIRGDNVLLGYCTTGIVMPDEMDTGLRMSRAPSDLAPEVSHLLPGYVVIVQCLCNECRAPERFKATFRWLLQVRAMNPDMHTCAPVEPRSLVRGLRDAKDLVGDRPLAIVQLHEEAAP